MNSAQLTAVRNLATLVYPFTLSFTREFTTGTFAGSTHEDAIGFCSAIDAEEWVSSVNRANAKGKCDYKVIKWTVAS